MTQTRVGPDRPLQLPADSAFRAGFDSILAATLGGPASGGGMNMTARNKISALCVGLNAFVEVGVGVVYFTGREIMPYHKEVLGVDWALLEPGVRTMLVAFMNAYGSAHFAVGIALGALLLVPMRQGQAWARWAALAVGLPFLGTTAYISSRLARLVEVGPPWEGALVLLLVFIVGIAVFEPEAAT